MFITTPTKNKQKTKKQKQKKNKTCTSKTREDNFRLICKLNRLYY